MSTIYSILSELKKKNADLAAAPARANEKLGPRVNLQFFHQYYLPASMQKNWG